MGGFLAGHEGEWIEQRRGELEQLELEAIEALAAASLSEPGHAAGAVGAARRLVSRAPFRESGYSLLMRALVAEGNPAEALVAYERLRLLLREELGTIPSVALSALHVWVLEQAGELRSEDEREPETHYARRRDGVSIAYQVLGEGPVDVVVVPGFMSHLDLQWADPSYRRWLRRLSSSLRVITLDKADTGASDAVARAQSMDDWADDVLAVLDATGSSRPVLMGLSEGSAVAAFFADTHPERVRGLVFYGALARVLPKEGYLWEHREEILAGLERFPRSSCRGAAADRSRCGHRRQRAATRSATHGRCSSARRGRRRASRGTLNNLALLCAASGRYREAESLYRRAIALLEGAVAPTHPTLVACRENHAALPAGCAAGGREDPGLEHSRTPPT